MRSLRSSSEAGKIEGATYCHRSALGIHIGASLHNVPERDEDDNNWEGEGEEDNDDTPGETPKDEYDGEDEDDAQFIDTNPVPSKHWTQSQQAQQDKQESSLVKEILSDDEKQQKSWMEAQKASKESASPSDGQPSSQGEGSGSVSGELDHQDQENKDESAVKEVTKLNTNKEASWLHAELFFVLVSMWLPQQHMVSIWTPHGIHLETLWCPVETTKYPLLKPCVVHLETTLCQPGNQMVSTLKPHGVHMETT